MEHSSLKVAENPPMLAESSVSILTLAIGKSVALARQSIRQVLPSAMTGRIDSRIIISRAKNEKCIDRKYFAFRLSPGSSITMNVNRVRHLENAIVHFETGTSSSDCARLSIESHLRAYSRAHKKKLSEADKIWISDKFKDMHRWRALVDHFTEEPKTVSNRLRTYFSNQSWRSYSESKTLPEWTRVSMPQVLFERLSKSFGKQKAIEIGSVWNEKSPSFLRINPLISTRERVSALLSSKKISVEDCRHSKIGLRLTRAGELENLRDLTERIFDLQDESCQLAGQQVDVKPGDNVLDFCSGSGGKSLVFGPALQGKGHLYLHDINSRYLTQAKIRLRSAGIKNYSCLSSDSCDLGNRLKRTMDWVLVDAPCTGSGQFRRYPERKWLFSEDSLYDSVEKQRIIFAEAVKYLKKSGKIVFCVSSILPEECIEQVKYFCNEHKLYLTNEPVHSLPESHGMDGFFTAVLEKQ